jgi:hypothetical protein
MLLLHEVLELNLIFPTASEGILMICDIGLLNDRGEQVGFCTSGTLIVLGHDGHLILLIWAAQVQARGVVKHAPKV